MIMTMTMRMICIIFFCLPGKPCCLSDVEVKLDLDESFFENLARK